MTVRMFVTNGLITVRLVPELAIEIGLHESLILLQVDYLLSTRGEQKNDGRRWVRQSVRDMQRRFFPFWSLATIETKIQQMITGELLIEGNWNLDPRDTTRWLSYGDGCYKLESVKMIDSPTLPYDDGVHQQQSKPKVASAAKVERKYSPYDMAIALATVCNMDFEMNKGRLLGEAKKMGDVNPGQIVELFGKQSPWYLYDFRGKVGSPPTPAQVRSEWAKMLSQARPVTAAPARNDDGSLNL